MARPPRAGMPATEHLTLRFTEEEMGRLDKLRRPGESRGAVVRRLLDAASPPALDEERAKALDAAAAQVHAAKADLLAGALRRMGFRQREIEPTVARLDDRIATTTLPDLVRAALELLGKAPS